MAERFYFLPLEPGSQGKGPKYLKWRFDPDPPGLDLPYILMPYGLIDACLACCNVTPGQHAELSAHPDVAAAPLDIDQSINPADVGQVQSVLEALRIPADWVNASYTYRDILRRIAGLFQFAQRFGGIHAEELIGDIAQLDLRWSAIPPTTRNKLQAAAVSMGYDISGVTGQWTARQILVHMADQWGDREFRFFLRNKIDVVL